MGSGSGAAVAPRANPAGVHVHESGTGVIADAASGESECRVAQSESVDTGNANVDGVRLHVQTVLGNSGGTRAEKCIAPGGAVTADDVDFGVGMADGGSEVRQDVEEARIVVLDFAGAVVAEEMVELSLGVREVQVSPAVNDVDPFSGVGVIKAQVMFFRRRDARGGGGVPGEGSRCRQQGETEK